MGVAERLSYDSLQITLVDIRCHRIIIHVLIDIECIDKTVVRGRDPQIVPRILEIMLPGKGNIEIGVIEILPFAESKTVFRPIC